MGDLPKTRTWNLWLRGPRPYPLGQQTRHISLGIKKYLEPDASTRLRSKQMRTYVCLSMTRRRASGCKLTKSTLAPRGRAAHTPLPTHPDAMIALTWASRLHHHGLDVIPPRPRACPVDTVEVIMCGQSRPLGTRTA